MTRVYPRDCPYLTDDAGYGVRENLIADVRMVDDPHLVDQYGFGCNFWNVNWDFVLRAIR